MTPIRTLLHSCLAALAGVAAFAPAYADEAAIRKNLTERLREVPQIDEITRTPMPGLYEVRIGTEIYYTDEQGNYFIEGQLIDTRSRSNLTQARVAKLTAIDPSQLPLKDAIVWKQGTGARKLIVFADPNCGYCKQFERTLQQVKDVTVYTFLLPILGNDSTEKTRNIWCAKDNTRAWRDWMIQGVAPVRSMGSCDAGAIERNIAFATKYKVNSTPSMVFEDGRRVAGAMGAEDLEKAFAASKKKS